MVSNIPVPFLRLIGLYFNSLLFMVGSAPLLYLKAKKLFPRTTRSFSFCARSTTNEKSIVTCLMTAKNKAQDSEVQVF